MTLAPRAGIRTLLMTCLLLAGFGSVKAQLTGLPPGVSREQMWWSPTAEDWAKPCLISWQRTWEDAQAVSRETGKPILACINMDGEIASEHYAGVRYRQPEIAVLYEPYVTVIASVYRHTEADHDESGRRILCPRFGSVTCGEHIAIEPLLHGRYMDDRRIAPRHIGVELDGQETYDVYYAFDTDSVFEAIRKGVDGRENVPLQPRRGEGSLIDRVLSRRVEDRQSVEDAYQSGDKQLKRALLESALEAGGDAPVELLRLAVMGSDGELLAVARRALSASTDPAAVDVIVEALSEPMEPAEREALVAGLTRLGQSSPRAATLAVVHQGLDRASNVDVDGWLSALEYRGSVRDDDRDPGALTATLERQGEVLHSDDALAHVHLAEAFLAQAYELFGDDEASYRYLLMDARETASEALTLGERGWRTQAVLGVANHYLGETAAAAQHAEAAMAAGLPTDALDWNTMAVLAIFAGARQDAISAAVREKRSWPPEWLSDVHAACVVLARHPHGTEEQVVAHHDFLLWLGAKSEANQVIDEGLIRHPWSWDLHERLRRRLLRERGVAGLLAHYESRLDQPDIADDWIWYAGYASLQGAELLRRAQRSEAASEAYERAGQWFLADAQAEPSRAASATRHLALVRAGQARMAFEAGDDARSLAQLLEVFELSPDTAGDLDGLNLSAVDTARALGARLAQRGDAERAAQLQATLDALDPAVLLPPAYETPFTGNPPARDDRGWRRRGLPRGS